MMKFDPNEKQRPTWPYATYVPKRKPQFKVHHKRNHAAAALTTYMEGVMYEWKDDKWVEIHRIENPMCCVCTPAEWLAFVAKERRWKGVPHLMTMKGVPQHLGPWYCYAHWNAARNKVKP